MAGNRVAEIKTGGSIFAAIMQVHRIIGKLPRFNKAVITIGTFDGVHLGHRKIIEALKEQATAAGGESVVITFEPHPRKIVAPGVSLQLINTLEEKTALLAQSGIDHLVIVPFTTEFANQSADTYIHDFLIGKFNPHAIIIGYDHHFGKSRSGNFLLLAERADQYQYKLLEIPKYLIDEIGVSSTKIRNALLQSDVDTANRLLGYPFFFEGRVVPGDRLGRTIGYPTANLESTDDDKIHLGHGVYAVTVDTGGKTKKGMLSIGNRPTLSKSDVKTEVNIFDFDREIYGETLRVHVHKYLRPQEKYSSLEALQSQLARDKEASLQYV